MLAPESHNETVEKLREMRVDLEEMPSESIVGDFSEEDEGHVRVFLSRLRLYEGTCRSKVGINGKNGQNGVTG